MRGGPDTTCLVSGEVSSCPQAGGRVAARQLLNLRKSLLIWRHAGLLVRHPADTHNRVVLIATGVAMTTTTLGIKLDEATRERLKSLAQAKDRAPHWVIKTALLEYLEREEAAEHERLEDEARWAHYQAEGQAIEQERVMAWLDQLAEGQRAPCPR
ncbi:MAG: hypothetical protein Q8O37_08700 [Sulfuricellaceae bacterium]|nr:hypothetical protein [Sulfuricellaceae bacterium]